MLTGGEKLLAKLAEIQKQASTNSVLHAGFLENADYPVSGQDKSGLAPGEAYQGGVSVATVAAIQEYGTEKIPSRSFFRPVIAAGKGAWGAQLGKVLMANNLNVQLSFALMGELICSQIAKSITSVSSPSLNEQTILARLRRNQSQKGKKAPSNPGFVKPLVDTGHMLRSTGYTVGEALEE